MYGATLDPEGQQQTLTTKSNENNNSKWKGIAVLGFLMGSTIMALLLVVGGATNNQGRMAMTKLAESQPLIAPAPVASSTENDTSSDSSSSTTTFTLSSPMFNDQDSLPLNYTCSADDGVGMSPPFSWSGAPEGTKSFAFILHSAKHWDWGLFNIPATQTSLTEGCSKPGNLDYESCGGYAVGSSPDRPMYYYTPPCSEGRGAKYYYFVVYALSEMIVPTATPNTDDDGKLNFYEYAGFTVADMLDQIEDITLASSTITTSFTRWTRDDDNTASN